MAKSIENQRNIVLNFIENHPEFKLGGIYIDRSKTGSNFERPEFKRMLLDSKNGKINCIVCNDANCKLRIKFYCRNFANV
jgi:DNA invertase Pin-like site-specific DNA recombinase